MYVAIAFSSECIRVQFSSYSRVRLEAHPVPYVDPAPSEKAILGMRVTLVAATIDRFITTRPPDRHPGQGFREAQLFHPK
jgi:hypothetical protein